MSFTPTPAASQHFRKVYELHADARGFATFRGVALVGHVVAVVADAHDSERRSRAARAQRFRAVCEVFVQLIYDGLSLHYRLGHFIHVFRKISRARARAVGAEQDYFSIRAAAARVAPGIACIDIFT